ncbi:hypothetical protein D3C72_836190 [compost metagenome]
MQPGLPDAGLVVEPLHHDLGRGRAGRQQTHPRHGGQVADHRLHRHLLEERLPHGRLGEPFRGQGLAREPRGLDQSDDLVRRLGRLGRPVRLQEGHRGDLGRGRILLGDPLVEGAVRLGDRLGVSKPQGVAVAPAVALLILDELVRQRVRVFRVVPVADGAAHAAAPATEAFDVAQEVEQVRADAGHVGQGLEGRGADLRVAHAGAHREDEERGVVLGGAAGLADLDHPRHDPQAVRIDAFAHRLGGLDGERLLADVVAAALGAEDQEAIQSGPDVQLPGEAAGGVRHLSAAGDRLGLRREAEVDVLEEVLHRGPPSAVGRRKKTGDGLTVRMAPPPHWVKVGTVGSHRSHRRPGQPLAPARLP